MKSLNKCGFVKLAAALLAAVFCMLALANISHAQQCNVQNQASVSSAAAVQNQAIADALSRLAVAQPRVSTATATSGGPSVSQLSALAQRSRSRSVAVSRGSGSVDVPPAPPAAFNVQSLPTNGASAQAVASGGGGGRSGGRSVSVAKTGPSFAILPKNRGSRSVAVTRTR